MEMLISGLFFVAAIFLVILSYSPGNFGNVIISLLVFVLTMLGTVSLLSSSLEENENAPKAIEVYQGKTTLQILYQDSIAIDSVVVYKK